MSGTMKGVEWASLVDTLHSCFTPTLLFLLLNIVIVIGTIVVAYRMRPKPDNPQSLLSRICSISIFRTTYDAGNDKGNANKAEGGEFNLGRPSSSYAISLGFGGMEPVQKQTAVGTIDYEGAGKIENVDGEKADVQGANFKNLTNKASPDLNIVAKNAGHVTNVGGKGAKVKGAQF